MSTVRRERTLRAGEAAPLGPSSAAVVLLAARAMAVTSGARARAATLAAMVIALAPAPPAEAHPFGPPPTALVHAEGSTVVIGWRSAADDAMAIGERLGILPAGSVDAAREGMTQVAPPASSEAELDRSPELRAYLTDRIRVLQNGKRCEATVRPIVDFVGRGAVTEHHCPHPVGVVEIEISMLHDIHEAYRTFAVTQAPGVRPGQTVHTLRGPRRRWDFTGQGAAGDAGGSGAAAGDGAPWPLLAAASAGAVLAAGGGLWLARRRHGGTNETNGRMDQRGRE